jgi:hypothetical protein
MWHTPGVDNVVPDALSCPPAPPPPVFPNQVQVVNVAVAAVADADLSPLDIKDMALQADSVPTGTTVASPGWPEDWLQSGG